MTQNNNINHPLPKDYIPYNSITVCSNKFVNLRYFIDDNGLKPLLIGQGEFPRIWIYTKNISEPIAVVKDNIAILPQVKVNYYQKERKISIELFDLKSKYIKLLEVFVNGESPIVTELDLRPIGYNIFGSSTNLNIGESKYQDNTFVGMDTLVKIDNKK